MELLESNDLKSELLRKSAKHREDLEGDVRLISEKTQKIVTNALIIGGSLALAYVLVRQFSGTSKKKKKSKQAAVQVIKAAPVKAVAEADDDDDDEEDTSVGTSMNVLSQVGTQLASQASAMLLALAKEKLTEYLASMSEKKADEHERA